MATEVYVCKQAGEDLDEDEDEDSEDDGLAQSYTSPTEDTSAGGVVRRALSRGPSALPQHMINERAPLLGPGSRANSKTRVGRRSVQGDATVLQAVLMVGRLSVIIPHRSKLTRVQLLKGFVGTGVLFLGKA
jgi:hypothetical protein